MNRRAVKRLMDVGGALVGLVFLSPAVALVAAGVWATMGSPVLFRQQRPGLDGRPFVLLKFRTMSCRRDGAGNTLPDEKRLTPLGRFLRSTSLDELPELLCVLKGEMSLVGPRPLLMEYLDLYTPEQARRHAVRPGLTGWTQVNGRNALTWEEKLRLDVWYGDNWSIALDVKILLLTVVKVLRREGVGAPGHETTMPKFSGSVSEGKVRPT